MSQNTSHAVMAQRIDDYAVARDERVPPCNFEAERALLGAILINNKSFEKVSEFLKDFHFAAPANRKVYELCASKIEKGHQASAITLKHPAETDPAIIEAGGFKFLTTLMSSAVTTVNAAHYGRIIYDLYLRRELIALGEDMVNDAFHAETDAPAAAQIETAETRLFELTAAHSTAGAFTNIREAMSEALVAAEAAYKQDGSLVGATTGLRDLDRRLGGLHGSDLIILAGRPSMGKTALATTIAYSAAAAFKAINPIRPKNVAAFSLEMDRKSLATRVLGHRTGLDIHKIRNGLVSGADIARMHDSVIATDIPLEVDDEAAPTISAIRSKCRRLARKGGLGLIVIDYLQLITPSRMGREENRVQEVSGITRGLKALAKELCVPVLALSQLSRAVENREDKRPQLSDLRDSGTIEQDADAVIFVYREQYYLERSEPQGNDPSKLAAWNQRMERSRNVMEAITAKQRQGPVGVERFHFDDATTWVSDLATTQRHWE